MEAFDIDLFLSKDEKDVQIIIDSNQCTAATIYSPPTTYSSDETVVRLAFDADAVIFSDESELINKKEGLEAFHKNESENEDTPLNEGPFATLIKKLSKIQEYYQQQLSLLHLE